MESTENKYRHQWGHLRVTMWGGGYGIGLLQAVQWGAWCDHCSEKFFFTLEEVRLDGRIPDPPEFGCIAPVNQPCERTEVPG